MFQCSDLMLSTVRIAEFDPRSYDLVDSAPQALLFGAEGGESGSSNGGVCHFCGQCCEIGRNFSSCLTSMNKVGCVVS
jgi:hypothetical protein